MRLFTFLNSCVQNTTRYSSGSFRRHRNPFHNLSFYSLVSTSPSNMSQSVKSKIYELRTYNIKPSCIGKYMQLTAEKYHIPKTHSKLIGFWTTEVGGVNEVVHLWEFDNLAHRASCWGALFEDSRWIPEYGSKVFDFFDKQHSELLTIPWGELVTSPSHEGGVYELRALHVGSGRSPALLQTVKDLTSLQEEIVKEKQGKLISVFSSEIGDCNIVYQLWNYKQLNDVLACKEALKDHSSYKGLEVVVNKWRITNKLLVPLAAISPLK